MTSGRYETLESEQALTSPGSALDRLTEAVAVRISRRSAIKVGVAGTMGGLLAAMGLGVIAPLTAYAVDCGTPGCSCCNSLCGNCDTPWTSCCSPGGFCATWNCTCPQCDCHLFRVQVLVCDNGFNSASCPCCCFACAC
jgi:hypothetical protein